MVASAVAQKHRIASATTRWRVVTMNSWRILSPARHARSRMMPAHGLPESSPIISTDLPPQNRSSRRCLRVRVACFSMVVLFPGRPLYPSDDSHPRWPYSFEKFSLHRFIILSEHFLDYSRQCLCLFFLYNIVYIFLLVMCTQELLSGLLRDFFLHSQDFLFRNFLLIQGGPRTL